MAEISDYLDLVTSEHADKPRFVQALTLSLKGLVDAQNLLAGMAALFDLDTAVGDQLDKTGEWIGLTKYLDLPLNVYFSWGVDGLGWGEGVWKSAAAPSVGLVALNDSHYRILLKARVVANHWDGTIPGAYTAWNTLFAPEGYQILIQDGLPNIIPFFGWNNGPQDEIAFFWGMEGSGWGQSRWAPRNPGPNPAINDEIEGWGTGRWYDGDKPAYRLHGDMTIILGLIAPATSVSIDPVIKALFTGGFLGLRPAGVDIRYYALQSVIGKPMFAWGVGPARPTLNYMTWGKSGSGWGQGNWLGTPVPSTPMDPVTAPPTNLAGWGLGAWPELVAGS